MVERYITPPEARVFGASRDRSYPAPREMLHLSVFHTGPGINDLVNFYQVVLNMRYVFHFSYPTFEFIALSHDDENHRVGFVNVLTDDPPGGVADDLPTAQTSGEPRAAPLRPCRLEHSTWLYPDFESIVLLAKRIHEELGIWPRTTRHGGRDLTIDYNDPDGNRVEMLSQTQSRGEILHSFYNLTRQTEYWKRTYGDSYLPIDMEKLLKLYEAGMPLSQLYDREYCRQLKEEGKL